MPELTTLVLTDRESTPVDHTFTRSGGADPNGVYVMRESADVPANSSNVKLSHRRTGNGNYVTEMRAEFPVVATETINGVNSSKLLRVAFAQIKFTFSKDSTSQERKNAIGMIQSALDATDPVSVAAAQTEGFY